MTATEFRAQIIENGKIEAVGSAASCPEPPSEEEANAFIYRYVAQLLDADKYGAAAIVLWGDKIFDPRPAVVKKIIKAIQGHALLLFQGGAALGKSYTPVVWLFLDWLRDPQYTNIKIISTTAGHAKNNTFSNLQRLARTACIPLPGRCLDDYIGLDPKERNNGMSVVAIPEGDDGKGRLQGFHPIPREIPHPKLGKVSRIRAFIDECEKVPIGLWEGVDNLTTSLSGVDTIKVIGAYNPNDPSTKTAQNAEPDGSWDSFDVDTGVDGSDEWESKNGWHVVRLDPMKTENIIERREIYPGFHTYEGYLKLESKNGGNSPEYWTFGRGAYPPVSSVRVIVQSLFLKRARGEFVFIGKTVGCAGIDVAVDGRDNAVLTLGRVGEAIGISRPGEAMERFKTPRRVLQADQQYELKKGDTKIVGDDIILQCKTAGIAPEWVMMDATGNGSAVFSYVKALWSESVQGVDFGSRATAMKILAQDKFTPEEMFEGVHTEVLFAMASWMEFGYLALHPAIRNDPLTQELLGRRYNNTGKRVVNGIQREMRRAEKKDEFKVRLHHSPDFAESLSLLLHGARIRLKVMGSMTGETLRTPRSSLIPGVVDRVKFIDLNRA